MDWRKWLKLNAEKSTSTIFTLDPGESKHKLNLTINNNVIPTVKNPKILGLIFDQKLNYNEQVKVIKEKGNKKLRLLKALTSTSWGKQKETIVMTYKTIAQPFIEYASTIWSPIISKTNMKH